LGWSLAIVLPLRGVAYNVRAERTTDLDKARQSRDEPPQIWSARPASVDRWSRLAYRSDYPGNRAPPAPSWRRGPGAAPPPPRARRHRGQGYRRPEIIELALDDWTLERLLTFDADAADLELEPDDEEDGPPVLILLLPEGHHPRPVEVETRA